MASEFFKTFLMDGRDNALSGAPPLVSLAGFGKHPGWDDHIEDIGLATASLRMARKTLYVSGIGDQIDKAAWENLEAGKRLPGFNHLFVWLRPNQMIVGRLWSSSDGKGRTRYPMIACAQGIGLPISWMAPNVAPVLEALRRTCADTQSAPVVTAAFRDAQDDLRKQAAAVSLDAAAPAVSEPERKRFFSDPAFGKDGEGIYRVFYHMNSQMSAYLPNEGIATSVQVASAPPRLMRVPRVSGSVEDNARLWNWFFTSLCVKSTPILLVFPMDERWVDVIMGEPTGHELFCLRASAQAIALASDIPYTMDAPFREKAAKKFARLEQSDGRLHPPLLERPSGLRVVEPASALVESLKSFLQPKTFAIIVAVVVLLLLAGVVAILRSGSARDSQRSGAPPGTTAVSVPSEPAAPAASWHGELSVVSKPPGAKVTVSGLEQGNIETNTPCVVPIPVSKVTSVAEIQVTTRFGGLLAQNKPVVVEKDRRNTVEFVFARGGVRLESVPAGAVVWVEGREAGRTPYADDNVAPGPATYELRLAGYNTDFAQVKIVADQVAQVKRTLTKGGGTVAVRSDPEGAEVLRLGVVLGRTPLKTKLEAGRQQLVVRHATLGEQTVDVDVKQDAEVGKEIRFARGTVRLASEPVGAEVWVDGKAVGVTPYEDPLAPPGRTVTYELRKGAMRESVQLQAAEGQVVAKSVMLTSGQGVVVMSSDPAGADIYWRTKTGDQLLGKTDAGGLRTKPIEKGEQRLVARHPALGELEVTVLVKADAEVAAKATYAYGSLVLKTEPANVVADVYAGEAKLGQTPYRVAMAKAGPVKYRVEAENYLAQTVEGEVLAGKTNELVAKLKPAQGTLELRSEPVGAEAYLDGQLLGKLPLTKAVDVGAHNLEVRCQNKDSQTKRVTLKKGQVVREEFFFGDLRASNGMEFVWVAGVPGTEKGCWVGKYEVTQEEYEKVMGANPSKTKSGRLPVTSVSFSDAAEFCKKLSEKDVGKGIRYALPAEAQWEYLAADARLEDSVTSKGLPEKRKQPEPVGSTGRANKFGLFDLRGNAMEWCDSPGADKPLRGGAYDGVSDTGVFMTLGLGYRVARPGGAEFYASGFRCVAVRLK
jgi:CRISPR/Cas system-associated exonuclease Cas4 (RecB family)